MSRKIETILEVIAEIRELRSTTMHDSPFADIRRQAVRSIAARHKRAVATIQNNWLRGLKPEISGTAEFDTLVEAYLSGVSNHIREILLQFAQDKSDRQKIEKELPEFEKASPPNGMHLSQNSSLAAGNGSSHQQTAEPPVRAAGERTPHPAPKAFDLRIRERKIRKLCTTYRVLRETDQALRVRRFHGDRCQICGSTINLADGSTYAETHHLRPLGAPHHGEDISENIICLCPNHHAMLDLGLHRLKAEELRTADGHKIAQEFIDYHNHAICQQAETVSAGA